jgi:toxin ParE1/3/4
MAKYRLTFRAREDLRRIYLYGLESFGEQQADKYQKKLVGSFDHIAKNPYMYQSIVHIRKGYRRCVCGMDSIFYRIVDNDIVEIVAILGRQDAEEI